MNYNCCSLILGFIYLKNNNLLIIINQNFIFVKFLIPRLMKTVKNAFVKFEENELTNFHLSKIKGGSGSGQNQPSAPVSGNPTKPSSK